jgi:hypothetical protein
MPPRGLRLTPAALSDWLVLFCSIGAPQSRIQRIICIASMNVIHHDGAAERRGGLLERRIGSCQEAAYTQSYWQIQSFKR